MEAMRLAPELGRFPDRLTFQEFFALSPAERRERRERLYSIPARLRAETGVPFNHEAQQPPLAYLPLALIEHIARAAPLYQRVWLMRMFTALASLALLLFGVERLGIRMALPPAWRAAAMFLLCSTQSVYAASAHACSDWLSVPMIALLFLTADYFYTRRDTRSTLLFAAVLATGLLAKAYFLVFVPFAVALVLFARARQVVPFLGLLAILAGPWYIRNWALYHSVTGLQTAVRVVPLRAVLDTAHSIRWPTTLAGLARGTLWTAIFLSFSWVTLSIMLVLLAVGFTFRLLVTRKQPPVFHGNCHRRRLVHFPHRSHLRHRLVRDTAAHALSSFLSLVHRGPAAGSVPSGVPLILVGRPHRLVDGAGRYRAFGLYHGRHLVCQADSCLHGLRVARPAGGAFRSVRPSPVRVECAAERLRSHRRRFIAPMGAGYDDRHGRAGGSGRPGTGTVRRRAPAAGRARPTNRLRARLAAKSQPPTPHGLPIWARGGRIERERDHESRENEDVLDPVIDAGDLDIPDERRGRSRFWWRTLDLHAEVLRVYH